MFVTVLSLPYRCTIVNYAFFLFFFFFLRTGSPIRSEHKYFCWGKGKGQQPRKTNKIVVTKQFLVKSEYVANAIVLSLENYFSSIKHRPPCSQLLFWNKMCLLPHTSFIHPSIFFPAANLLQDTGRSVCLPPLLWLQQEAKWVHWDYRVLAKPFTLVY